MSERLALRRGDRKQLILTVTKPDGTAADLTNTPAIRFAMARRIGAPAAIEKSLGDGIEITGPAEGEVTVTLEPYETAALAPGGYYFELQLQDVDGAPTTVEFTVSRLFVLADQIR